MAMPRARRDGGFTYLSVIILVAIIGLVTAATLKMGSVLQRSRAEQQLLDIGEAFSDALQSYADATPAGMPTQPPSLQELIRDPRFTQVRRHLRQIYVDPMTGKAEWGIVYLANKAGVVAVYSLSDAKPVKIGNFPPRYMGFEGKQKISDWRFAATGKAGAPGTAAAMPAVPSGLPNAPGQPALPPPVPPAEPAPAPEAPAEQGEPPVAPPSERPAEQPAPPPTDAEPPPADDTKTD